jgi:hypothetical protein
MAQSRQKTKLRDKARATAVSPIIALIRVKVVPGSSRNRIASRYADGIRVQTSAPPEKGKANAAVAEILAEFFGIKPGQVSLASSPSNPRKVFQITGMEQSEVDARIANLG